MTDLGALHGQMTEWRHDLHLHPEFGFEESRTSAFVAEKLRSFGIEVAEGIGGTDVVGTLKRGMSDRAIALRADMDALRITEAGGVERASQNPGTMHACGHDGHTTMLLGAAKLLAEEGGFDGTARSYNVDVEVDCTREFVPLVNDAELADEALAVAKEQFGEQNARLTDEPVTSSEDFARFLDFVPGCFVNRGNGESSKPLHNSEYDVNDAGLIHGVNFHAKETDIAGHSQSSDALSRRLSSASRVG